MRPLLRPEPALSLALLRVVVAALMPLAPGFREGRGSRRGRSGALDRARGAGVVRPPRPDQRHAGDGGPDHRRVRARCARSRACGRGSASACWRSPASICSRSPSWPATSFMTSPALVLRAAGGQPLRGRACGRRPAAAGAEGKRVRGGADSPCGCCWARSTSSRGCASCDVRPDWALSDNLRFQLYWKWAQYGVVPRLRLDQRAVAAARGRAVRARLRAVVRRRWCCSAARAPWPRWRAWRFISCRSWSSDCCSPACGSATWRWWTGGRCSGACFPARRGGPRTPNPASGRAAAALARRHRRRAAAGRRPSCRARAGRCSSYPFAAIRRSSGSPAATCPIS